MAQTQRYWLLASVTGAAILLVLTTQLLQPILMPFVTGILLAYLVDPIVDRFERKNINRTVAVVIVFVVMSALIGLGVLLIMPLLGRQLDTLVTGVPVFISWLQEQVLPLIQSRFDIPQVQLPVAEIKAAMSENWQSAGRFLALGLDQLGRSSFAVIALLANLLLIPVVTFYLLRDWDTIIAKIKDMMPRSIEPIVSKLALECDEVLSAFLRGQLLVMMCLGLVYTLGLVIVGLELALLLGTLAGLASVVPYMGFIVGFCASGIAAYLQFHDPMVLVYVGIVFGIGQLLEGMVLTPLLVGDKIGLHPVTVIFAIMAGGQLAGFVGVLAALPVAAIIMVLLRYLFTHYRASEIYNSSENS